MRLMDLTRAGAIAALLFGCGSNDTPTTQDPPPQDPRPEAPAGPLVDDPTFELRATAHGPYHPGEQASFEIRLTPKGNYHVNQDFPTTVSVTAPSGVTLPHAELAATDAAEMREQLARFDVPFTAQAGEHRVTARVSFAVCTPEQCMPDERTLALSLPVQ
jgi:hypothetical protein